MDRVERLIRGFLKIEHKMNVIREWVKFTFVSPAYRVSEAGILGEMPGFSLTVLSAQILDIQVTCTSSGSDSQ